MRSQILRVVIPLLAAQLEATFSVEYGGKQHEYRITEQDLKRAPSWQPGQENPPLSATSKFPAAERR